MTSRFYPSDNNMIFSGSSDGSVKFWDLRSGDCQIAINAGLSMCGDALDIDSNLKSVVTGAGRSGEGILLWDLRHTKSHMKNILWDNQTSK